jgi:hypothetical protein
MKLIPSVTTVVVTVTFPFVENASSVLASIFIGLAGAANFVTSVPTVLVTITEIFHRDTGLGSVSTVELVGDASSGVIRASSFIRCIFTIVVTIASVRLSDALQGADTVGESFQTVKLSTVGFIRPI